MFVGLQDQVYLATRIIARRLVSDALPAELRRYLTGWAGPLDVLASDPMLPEGSEALALATFSAAVHQVSVLDSQPTGSSGSSTSHMLLGAVSGKALKTEPAQKPLRRSSTVLLWRTLLSLLRWLSGSPDGRGVYHVAHSAALRCGTIVALFYAIRLIVWYMTWSPIGREWMSPLLGLLSRLVRQPKLASASARAIFQIAVPIAMKPNEEHTHGESAAVRTASSAAIGAIAGEMGYTPYYLQLSESDVRAGRAGCRSWFWGKDMSVAPTRYAPPSDAATCIVDVDMYLDMPRLLATYPGQYLISTFQPTKVAEQKGEYSFTFDAKGEVHYRVSGGASYHHPVWNYSGDVLVAVSHSLLGLITRVVVYTVDKRQTDPHHEIVCLSPVRRFLMPFWDISPLVEGTRLTRLNPVRGDFLRLDVATKSGILRSTGRVDSFAECTLPAALDDAVAEIAKLSTVDLSLAQVRQTTGLKEDVSASVLVAYHRQKVGTKAPVVYPIDMSVDRYQFGTYEPEAKPAMIPFMHPFLKGCYVPDQTRGNEEQMAEGRVLGVKSLVTMTPFVSLCMDEFITQLIPEPNRLQPVDIPDVYEHQPRPSQRALLARAGLTVAVVDEDPFVEVMMKKEAYQKPTDPRPITIIPPVTKANYSRYIYAFATILKKQKWYAFAKKPVAVARRVAEIAQAARSHVANADANRWDGHLSEVMRAFERRMMMRAFVATYHDEMITLMQRQYGRDARTRKGFKYPLGWARGSGSSETSDFNTPDNAFIAYLAFRMSGCPPNEAWDRLGIYGGDDALTADIDIETYRRAGRAVGQVIEAEAVMRHDYGVKFLARYYSPYVWHGSLFSMCDLPRTLSKFHVTVALPIGVSPMQKLREKCTGYVQCDPNTPYIGPLCRVVLKMYGSTESDFGLKPYHVVDVALEDQYPNANEGNWMVWQSIKLMPQVSPIAFGQWLYAVEHGAADVLSPPLIDNDERWVQPKQPAVVNGVLRPPSAAVPPLGPSVSVPLGAAPGNSNPGGGKGRNRKKKAAKAAKAAAVASSGGLPVP